MYFCRGRCSSRTGNWAGAPGKASTGCSDGGNLTGGEKTKKKSQTDGSLTTLHTQFCTRTAENKFCEGKNSLRHTAPAAPDLHKTGPNHFAVGTECSKTPTAHLASHPLTNSLVFFDRRKGKNLIHVTVSYLAMTAYVFIPG